MRTLLIHLRRNLIIRKGLGNVAKYWDLDNLNDDLSFDTTIVMGDEGEGREELFGRLRGTGGGRGSIPDDGWVRVEVEDDATLPEIWEKAKEEKENENFV